MRAPILSRGADPYEKNAEMRVTCAVCEADIERCSPYELLALAE